MVTRGLWNLHVDGKWYRWFHPPRGQSSSPDSQATLKTIHQMVSKSDQFKWEIVPFPTPLHFHLDYVYTIDEDAGHFTVTQWSGDDGVLYRIARRATLASIRETSLLTIDTLLSDVVEIHKPEDDSLGDMGNETNVQHLLESFGIKPNTPARLNELQFQLFADFVFTWRFYFDDTYTYNSSSAFSALAIGLLRIAAWDFEVRNADTEEIPISFSSLPQWKVPPSEIFWFHKHLIVCCHIDQIGFMLEKAKHVVSQGVNQKRPVHGIVVSIRHITLFEICDGDILRSAPIPLFTNTSALDCSPGFRILAYTFTSHRYKDFPAGSKEHWGITLPTELFEMILPTSKPWDLVSMAQASDLVEEWYYSSIPQIHGVTLQNFAFSIPCCGKRDTPSTTGVHCSLCYAWSHLECAGLSTGVPSGIEEFTCSDCQESKPCASLETGGIHQFYREKRVRKACSVIHSGETTNFRLRVNKPASRRPELWLIRALGPPPPRQVDYSIFFSGVFSGLAYGFDD
ncbi:unnamed protein product [Penicillium salamii]|nr:unnamed protein product [Penicillium salamii]CAG8227545.1 unnamed protein product [Penicillium salamii]